MHPGGHTGDAGALADRATARAALGVRDAERAVLLLADPPGGGDARRFAHRLGILSLAGERVVGLVHAESGELGRAVEYTAAAGYRWRLAIFQGAATEAANAADVVFWDRGVAGTEAGLAAAAAAVAQGATVVVTPGPGLVELGLLSPDGRVIRADGDGDRAVATALRLGLLGRSAHAGGLV